MIAKDRLHVGPHAYIALALPEFCIIGEGLADIGLTSRRYLVKGVDYREYSAIIPEVSDEAFYLLGGVPGEAEALLYLVFYDNIKPPVHLIGLEVEGEVLRGRVSFGDGDNASPFNVTEQAGLAHTAVAQDYEPVKRRECVLFNIGFRNISSCFSISLRPVHLYSTNSLSRKPLA